MGSLRFQRWVLAYRYRAPVPLLRDLFMLSSLMEMYPRGAPTSLLKERYPKISQGAFL